MKTQIFFASRKIRYLAMLALFTLLSTIHGWGAEQTITLNYNSFELTTSYAKKTVTVDGISFTVDQGYKGQGNSIQMNSSKGSGILYNSTPIQGLKSIEITVYTGTKTYTVTNGTSEKPTTNSETGTTTNTFSMTSGSTYFQIKVSGATYFTSVVITYETEVETCSDTDADRQVEITVTPATCYSLPSSTRLSFSGVSATYISGPTNNKFVYQFAQNANGTATVGVSLSTKTTYTISYKKGANGTGTETSDTKTCGTNLTLKGTIFTRTGYNQTGWATTDGGSKVYDLSGSYTSNSDATLYPVWTEKSLTNYRTSCCMEWVAPALSGYLTSLSTGGTTTISVGSGTVYGARTFTSSNPAVLTVNPSGVISAVGAGKATVTVTWAGDATYCEQSVTTNEITVTGNLSVSFAAGTGGSGTMSNQAIPYNTATKLNKCTFTAPACKEFDGWSATGASGPKVYDDEQTVTLTEGVTLTARWKTITYTVTKGTGTGAATFTLSPASTVNCGGTITVTATADATHKGSPIVTISPADAGTVSGTSITNVTKNITVNVSFAEKASYTITWEASGATYTTSNVLEGNAVTLPATDPTSCSDTYGTFVGWYTTEAGSESDPSASAPATQVTTSTRPTDNVTYYAVFADGGAGAVWTELTELPKAGDIVCITNTARTNEYNGVSSSAGTVSAFTTTPEGKHPLVVEAGSEEGTLSFKDGSEYLQYSGTSNALYTDETKDESSSWTVSVSDGQFTITNANNTGRVLKYNSGSPRFCCYASGQQLVRLWKQGTAATGYISTCGTNMKIAGDVKITAANGIWVEGADTLKLTGTKMTANADNVTVVVKVSEGNTSVWRVKDATAGTAGPGGTTGLTFTDIITADWTRNIVVTYTPTSANVTEEATITVLVKKKGTTDATAYVTKDIKVKGRSLPANLLIAVNDGTAAAGHWYAVPADMVVPFGSSCGALGTYQPIPITVDNPTNPTKATVVPSRAVYQPVVRSTPNTNPQTLRFKSKALTGGTYYLYGSRTGEEGTNSTIQNTTTAASEQEKWFLETTDLQKYTMHLSKDLTDRVLAFTTAGGNNRVGEYDPNVSTTKKDVYFLSYDVAECAYFRAPKVEGISLDDTYYTIQFPKDRGATAWKVSIDGGTSWVALPNKTELACSSGVSEATTIQSQLPLDTYRGKEVKIKVDASPVCSENIATFTVPNPLITVTSPWNFVGVKNVAFSDNSKSITLSGLYTGAGATNNVTSSNPKIGASVDWTTGQVTVTMTAANAQVGTYNTTLTFSSTGAVTKTVEVTIVISEFALPSIESPQVSDGYYCINSAPEAGYLNIGTTTAKLYDENGNLLSSGNWGTYIHIYLIDVTDGDSVSLTRNSSSPDGIVMLNLAKSKCNETGHTYRFYFNYNRTGHLKTVYDENGIPYQPTVFEFTAIDCSIPTALPACPVSNTGFTAKWMDRTCASANSTIKVLQAGSPFVNVAVGNHTLDVDGNTLTGTDLISSSYYKDWGFASSTGNEDKWLVSDQEYKNSKWQKATPSPTANGIRLEKANDKAFVFTPRLGEMTSGVTTSSIFKVTVKVYNYSNKHSLMCIATTTEPNWDISPTTGNTAVWNGASGTSWTSDEFTGSSGLYKTFTFTVSGLTATTRLGFGCGCYNSVAGFALSAVRIEKINVVKSVTATCSTGQAEITGLTAGTSYFYTVTNNGNTSNEVAVDTRKATPTTTFFPAKVDVQADVNGTITETVTFTGKNYTACDVETIVSNSIKTGSSYFTVTPAGEFTYDAKTGNVSGTLTVTYNPTAEGNHTGTYTVGGEGTALVLEGHACPAGFGNMATGATSVTKNSAVVGWSQNTTGVVMLAQGTRMNTELLSNGGFELGLAGWDENYSVPGDAYNYQHRTGSYSRYCTNSNATLVVNGRSGFVGVYTNEMTLLPGTYHLEAYVRHAESSSTTGAFNAAYNDFYIGVCNDTTSRLNSYLKFKSVVANADYAFQFNNAADAWKKIECNFTLTESLTGRVFIGRTTSSTNLSYFFLDDVSLQLTAAGDLTDETLYTEAAEVTNAHSTTLTGLKPQTTYSYYVVSAAGCKSNIRTFTTSASTDPVTITANPNPVNITGPLGKTVTVAVSVSTENAYSQVVVSTGTCSDGRIKVTPTSLPADGGMVTLAFTPLTTDEMGASGSCKLLLSTTGAAQSTEVTVNWSVSSGFDPTTPVVEVVDISNTDMSIEHNVTKDAENTTVKIILNRETTAEEREENVGDEIFFSKYYEANKNVKLLAVFNPTKDTISLAGTYIWLSRDGKEYWGHNENNKLSLAGYGKIKPGYICPSEEIIFYRYQSNVSDDAATIECAMGKVDMSDWNLTYSDVLSFSGNDAFVLVRDTTVNKRIPPAISCAEGNPALSWNYIGAMQNKTVSTELKYAMLDIIGARTENNYPSNANNGGKWTWKNCKATGTPTETGDDSGWWGYGVDLTHESYSFYNCGANAKYGYLLSTNRCLLIRLKDVKSGSNAVQQNIGDFNTLDWQHSLEWQGTHVPMDADDDKEIEISCENFSFIGGYDYAGYYNKWTPLEDDEYIEGDLQSDGSWLITLAKGTPHYYCKSLRIQVAEMSVVNGVEVENVHASQEYKVPIVIDGPNENTTDTRFRGSADASNASDPDGQNTLTEIICDSCDVVIRGGAKLTHNNNAGQSKFRNVQVYAGGKLDIGEGKNMELSGIQVRSTNDAVGYAIINNADASITIDTIEHVKRIDDSYWYPFSLPYDCKVSHIRQLNGKTMGEYGDMAGNGDWMIQKYDGYNRQKDANSASAGENGLYWVRVEPGETLKAHQAYIIGLYTTETVTDELGNTYSKMKYVYFPPLSQPGYTENGTDTKTANVTAWKDGSTAAADQRHHGWNFVGLPYLSVFDPAGLAEASAGVNNSAVMIMGKINDKDGTYTDTENVYVSIPDGGSTRTYTQVTAKNQKLEPFKGYFIQVKDGTVAGATGETKTIAYSKTGRTLNKAPRLVSTTGNARARIEMAVTELTEQPTAEPLTDNAGLLVSDDYTMDYEIGLDLTKMYAAAAKPQLFSLTADNQKLAYNALPVDNAQYIPLGFYAPKKGTYILSVKEKQSELDNVTAVWLLYNGQEVKNLMFGDFQINATKKGLIEGYAVRVDMAHKVPTIISTETDGTDNITISQQDGKLFVDGVEEGATITLYDMVGKQMSSAKAFGGYAEVAAPVAGSYNIVVRTDKKVTTIKTVVR